MTPARRPDLAPPDAALPDAVAGLWARVLDLTDRLAREDWTRPTPCPDWTVKDLLGHLSGVQVGFDGTVVPDGAAAPPAGASELDGWVDARVAARRDWSPARVLAELEAAARGHEARLRAVDDWDAPAAGPLGPTSERGLAHVRCFDLWVHLQDLRDALGLPCDDHDPSPAARAAFAYVLRLVPWLFARRVRAGEGAALGLRLDAPADVDTVVALRSGRGVFAPDADPHGAAVAGDPAAFTLLVTGRRDPAHWRALGLLRWSGEGGAAFVERARVF